ncbi:sulfatase-like hydrolase/transferase [Roseibacillus ishigakijimensis]|uniref:Sulfatase-like hydrolase/transferase n=1 Tax=Roseibacillus ishigakijimensis TaxID=454146 RepID=A0A934RU87_9BACT|nr:sulfatase-like hydrolase/transferase [Roseibacillus ishigakijimensis]MBK1834270.1 sulfatase-like hydrolase/transferase [Roseibacillus ishigakijimensis]
MKPLLILLACLLPLAARQRPNILFLLSDDQAWGDYGFMGHLHIETPHLDALAARSLTFTRGYSPVPLCRPSLASILTGRHPHEHRITGNDLLPPRPDLKALAGRRDPDFGQRYRELIAHYRQQPNWIQSLRESGYRTLQTGKWWEGDPVADGGFTAGMTHGDPARGGRHGDAGLAIGRQGLQPIKDFTTSSPDTPWFVWYGVFLPHTPHNPPADLLAKYLQKTDNENIAAYWACCEWLDQTIGELLAHLEESGQLDNTLILYTCDNGWIQDPADRNLYAPRSKQTIYEGGIRTPILLSWPGHLQPLRDDEHLASNLDLWPTAAALCDLPLPAGLPGINLTDRAAVTSRQSLFGADYSHDIRDFAHPARNLEARYHLRGPWKLLLPHPPADPAGEPQLYHLLNDPHERHNLASEHPDLVESLRQGLNDWWTPAPAQASE